jgi:hypothetical protein
MSDTIQVVSVDEVLAYLGIDYTDEMVTRNIERAIKTADAYLKGSIGRNYPIEDPRAKELALMIVADLYDNRGLTVSTNVSANMRKLVDDMSLQLRLELRRAASNG